MIITKEKTAYNSIFAKGGVSCSKESFVVNQTFVFEIKFCGKKPPILNLQNVSGNYMITLELKLYQTDFNVQSNYGSLNRILRSIIIPCLVAGLIILYPVSKELVILMSFCIVIGGMYLADTYLRKIYPDWPNSNKFIGTITLSENMITINKKNENIELSISECNELVLFADHYTGYVSNMRDIKRNGNGLLFYKNNDGKISVFKFNIFDKKQHDKLENLIDFYKVQIPYFKKYLPNEIKHILKTDLFERIKYH